MRATDMPSPPSPSPPQHQLKPHTVQALKKAVPSISDADLQLMQRAPARRCAAGVSPPPPAAAVRRGQVKLPSILVVLPVFTLRPPLAPHPHRWDPSLIQDPTIYRLHEATMLAADALKAIINEECGGRVGDGGKGVRALAKGWESRRAGAQ